MNNDGFRYDDSTHLKPVEIELASAMGRIYPWFTYDPAPREQEADTPHVVQDGGLKSDTAGANDP